MNLTENKDTEKKIFEERIAKMKENGFKEIDVGGKGKLSLQDATSHMDRLKEIVDQNGAVSKVLDRHKKVQDDLASITSKKFDVPSYEKSAYQLKDITKSINEAKAREKRELIEYRESVVQALQGIEKNTAILTEMTTLLQKNSEKQEEIFAIMIEIMEIMKSSNKEEAETKFAAVTRKITTFTENAGTVTSLIGMAQTVFNALPF